MHKRITIFALIVAGLITNTEVKAQRAKSKLERTSAAIRAVLEAQREAWNRGDIDGYMRGYDQSEDTVFISGDTVTRGWQTVLDRYKRVYYSPEKMGTLTFTDLDITTINSDTAVVIGRWQLQRVNDEPHGRFTLIFRRGKQGWKIIHDHTSSA